MLPVAFPKTLHCLVLRSICKCVNPRTHFRFCDSTVHYNRGLLHYLVSCLTYRAHRPHSVDIRLATTAVRTHSSLLLFSNIQPGVALQLPAKLRATTFHLQQLLRTVDRTITYFVCYARFYSASYRTTLKMTWYVPAQRELPFLHTYTSEVLAIHILSMMRMSRPGI
jgi:hypothetical protein